MPTTSEPAIEFVSRPRAVLTIALAVCLLTFNYGTNVSTPAEGAGALLVYLVVGYLAFTLLHLLSVRFWWE